MAMIKIKSLFLIASYLILPLSVLASAQIPAPPQKAPVALVGGTIHPLTSPDIEEGTILFDRGRIVDLGKEVAIPSDAVVVDIRGRHVYPGLIAASSILGLVEIDAIRATRDIQEIRKIPANVTVITKEEIEKSNSQTSILCCS